LQGDKGSSPPERLERKEPQLPKRLLSKCFKTKEERCQSQKKESVPSQGGWEVSYATTNGSMARHCKTGDLPSWKDSLNPKMPKEKTKPPIYSKSCKICGEGFLTGRHYKILCGKPGCRKEYVAQVGKAWRKKHPGYHRDYWKKYKKI